METHWLPEKLSSITQQCWGSLCVVSGTCQIAFVKHKSWKIGVLTLIRPATSLSIHRLCQPGTRSVPGSGVTIIKNQDSYCCGTIKDSVSLKKGMPVGIILIAAMEVGRSLTVGGTITGSWTITIGSKLGSSMGAHSIALCFSAAWTVWLTTSSIRCCGFSDSNGLQLKL